MAVKSTKLRERPSVGKLTVPYMVDEKRKPIDFKSVDADHVKRCAQHDRCGVCGGKIRTKRRAFIGPDDGRRCFADPWMHEDCAKLAMVQCPFLAAKRDWRSGAAGPLLATYARNMALFVGEDGRSHRDQIGAWHFEAVGELAKVEVPA